MDGFQKDKSDEVVKLFQMRLRLNWAPKNFRNRKCRTESGRTGVEVDRVRTDSDDARRRA